MRGRTLYVPRKLLLEKEAIKQERNIQQDAEAFNKMAEFCSVGREVEKMRDRFFLKDIRKRRRK